MALPTSAQYASKWYDSEKTQIVSVCSPATGAPPPINGAADKIPDVPVPPQAVSFSYVPGSNPITNLMSNWGFKDAYNFSAIQGNSGYAPPGYSSTYMTKASGTNSGWGTTPLFTAVDRTQDGFTVQFEANWSYTTNNPLAGSNFLCVSLTKWSGSTPSYDYNFYYRPKNWMDAYETNDYSIYKGNFGTQLGQAASHDYSTWTGDWISYKIQVEKVQSAGGTGQIRFYGYHPQIGWRLFKTVVDNQYSSFNSIDFWHSTDPNAETTVQIDNIIVRKGTN